MSVNEVSAKETSVVLWENATAEEWNAENDRINGPFVDGNLAVQLPEGFFRIDMEFGTFIEVQPCYRLKSSHRPGVWVRLEDISVCSSREGHGHSKDAMKVLMPYSVAAGDRFVLTELAKSGKSWHCRILEMDEKFDTQMADGTIVLARQQRVVKDNTRHVGHSASI